MGALCARCGEALDMDPALAAGAVCRVCRAAEPPFEKAVAHGAYEGTLRALLHLFKYDGMRPVGSRLGVLLAGQILAIPGLPDELLVVPVPLFEGKRRQRGFNQAEVLARRTTGVLRQRRPGMGITLATDALRRRRATKSQAGLSPHERRVNLRGAFFVPRPALVADKDVLLIDDIYTTGATARACASALRRAGAKSVRVATVARAQWESARRPERLDSATTCGLEQPKMAVPELPMEEDFALWEDGRAVQTSGQGK